VFTHHLCIPVLSVGFGGNGGGQYHTTFDDFSMVDRFLDPGWVGHEMLGGFLAELLPEMAARPGAGFDVAEAARAMARRSADVRSLPALGEDGAAKLAAAFESCAERAAARAWSAGDRPQRFFAELASTRAIPGRAWFENSLWAPALDNGYGAETFPHLRYAGDEAGELASLLARIEGALEHLTAPAPAAGH